MRTQQEILDRIEERIEADPLGFEVGEYVDFLDYTHAKSYLENCTEEEWNKIYKEPTKENVISTMQDYIEFAWEKADSHRGLSANRSIEYYLAWIWLAEDDDFLRQVQDEYDNYYSDYGKSILMMIAPHFSLKTSFIEL